MLTQIKNHACEAWISPVVTILCHRVSGSRSVTGYAIQPRRMRDSAGALGKVQCTVNRLPRNKCHYIGTVIQPLRGSDLDMRVVSFCSRAARDPIAARIDSPARTLIPQLAPNATVRLCSYRLPFVYDLINAIKARSFGKNEWSLLEGKKQQFCSRDKNRPREFLVDGNFSLLMKIRNILYFLQRENSNIIAVAFFRYLCNLIEIRSKLINISINKTQDRKK